MDPTDLTIKIDPRGALDAAIDAARLVSPVIDGPQDVQHVMLPVGYKLEALKDAYALPPYIHQRVTVDDRISLSAYANRFSDTRSIIMADYDAGQINAALDWHGDNMEGELRAEPRKHTCTLHLRPSEEFSRWDKFEGQMHSQAEFAAFLEENATDVILPEPAILIEISRDLEAVQGVNFKQSTRLESGDRAFTYETETQTKGDVKVPREFVLAIPLYNGEEPVQLRAALRFKVTGGGLLLGFEWRRVEYMRRAHFVQIATQVCEETGLPVFYGRATG